MKQFPWDILLALLAGLGLGLVYSWLISPVRVYDSEPAALRADFKDQYRTVIAAAYAATGNLPRAQARLSLLKDPNPIEALNAQAQRTLASGGSLTQADQLAALALALQTGTNLLPVSTPHIENTEPSSPTFPPTFTPIPTDVFFTPSETPEIIETPSPEPVINIPTPRPTRTPVPTVGAPFALIAQDTLCDPNLPDGLLQVMVFGANRRQLPGVKIIITWETGEEQFFTGLKPELGNGYADFLMRPDTIYTVQLAAGSDIAANLVAPSCQSPSGETFLGSIKLTFQQP
ncbi:MAG TPA: hypothetical protein VNK49_13715 [Anaerolineales bacterium]|nr:hypothetical protein [Anaerolineales bacterium]